ncbi:MAG: substrate-binding domain-containing protein [Bacillota bacterium]|nr:substrate-binding domain-containing protein [Bacillota bacterium]
MSNSEFVGENKILDDNPLKNQTFDYTIKSKYIMVMLADFSNILNSMIIKGIEGEVSRYDYKVIVVNCHNDEELQRSFLPLLTRKVAAGLIIACPYFNTEEMVRLSRRFPIVQCGHNVSDEIPFVAADNERAAFDIVNMIIKKGRKRIAFFTTNNLRGPTVGRLKGYISALNKNGIPFDKDLVFYGTYGFRNSCAVTEKFLYENPDVDGIFALCDRMAAGAITAIKKLGKRIPDDISVGSIDNVPSSYEIQPNLTTVYHRQEEMGQKAAEMLIKKIKRRVIPQDKVFIGYDIIIRDSI